MARPTARTYRIRKFQNGRSKKTGEAFINYSLTIPTALAEQLPSELTFGCELLPEITLPNDDSIPEAFRGRTISGILFEPVEERSRPTELPDWARRGQNGTAQAPKPQRARSRPGKKKAEA